MNEQRWKKRSKVINEMCVFRYLKVCNNIIIFKIRFVYIKKYSDI